MKWQLKLPLGSNKGLNMSTRHDLVSRLSVFCGGLWIWHILCIYIYIDRVYIYFIYTEASCPLNHTRQLTAT